MKITANVLEYASGPNEEFLGKFSKERADKLKENATKKSEEKQKLQNSIPTGISKEEYQARQAEIDKKLEQTFTSTNPKPIKTLGENGTVVSQHKDKLAFIFIGDTEKAEKSETKTNSPKISMIVGGGLETTVDPKTGNPIEIDPRKDNLLGVSSQLHLISVSDIDVEGILPNKVTTLRNRSSIKTEADVLELNAGEIVLIRSLGRPYKSSGARSMTPGGVHIVSGINTDKEKIKEPEPMVLGKSLSEALLQMTDKISDINSVLLSINQDILSLKIALIGHTHVTGVPSSPTTPSIDLIASIAPSITTNTVLNITNAYSNLINMELLKLNNLTPLSEQKFLSSYNRVN